MNMLATMDPSLWRIKKTLIDRNINPDVIPPIIAELSAVLNNTRYGEVIIAMENGVIKIIKGVSYRKVDIDVE